MKTHHFLLLILTIMTFSSLCAQEQDITWNDKLMIPPSNSLMRPIESQAILESKPLKPTHAAVFQVTDEYTDLHSYVQSTVKFPEEGRIIGRYGKVRVQFEILPNGNIGKIRFLESPHPVYEKEISRILQSMPAWKPAYFETLPVSSKYYLTLNFTLK